MKRAIFLLTMFLVLVSLGPTIQYGQQASVISGNVQDDDGKPLMNATITFVDPKTGNRFVAKTDKKGRFMRAGIPASTYEISVELEDYHPQQIRYNVRFGSQRKLTFTLKKIQSKIEVHKDFVDGAHHFREGHYKEASKSFRKTTEKFPESYQAFFYLGLSYLNDRIYDEAVEALEKAKKLETDRAEIHLALGECYYHKEKKEKAVEAFKKAIQLQPKNARAHYGLGMTYYRYDELEESMSALKRSIVLDPEYSSAYYLAGLTSHQIGDIEKALIYFEEFLRLTPDAVIADQVRAIVKELREKISR